MKRIVAAALLVAGISGEAGADGFINGNMLLQYCREPRGTFGFGACSGYVTAIADALARDPVGGYRACMPPDSVTAGQVRDIAVQWLQRNPQLRHYSAEGLVAKALSEAFPCR